MKDHIAIDIGASSGRLFYGKLADKKSRVIFKEIFRFENRMFAKEGGHYWDMDYLFANVIEGLREAKRSGIDECTVSIDTWGVDYVLVDSSGNRLNDVFTYRDPRTADAVENLVEKIPPDRIYAKTGIQFLQFNTLFQLFVHDKEQLKRTHKILMIPDYLNFLLTGKYANEITNASTTQLLNINDADYDTGLLSIIGVVRNQFAGLIEPGTPLGAIKEDLVLKCGLPQCEIIAAASHDTASAVFGIPLENGNSAYVSCGTWSLLGLELDRPVINAEAMRLNYTNERGVNGTTRFLKNIGGLWLLQEVKRILGKEYSYEKLVDEAAMSGGMKYLINCSDPVFLNPPDMIEAIKNYCKKTGQEVPLTPGEITRCIIDSLSLLYDYTVNEIEQLAGKKIECVNIAGGGVNNGLLCRTACDVLQRKVLAGPVEAAACGNLFVQMTASGEIENAEEARSIIKRSFPIKEYYPGKVKDLGQVYEKFKKLMIFY